MLYKYLLFLAFLSPYNVPYNLQQIQCPRWVPESNEILPEGVTFSPAMELHNKMRCFCQVVKVQERECLETNVPREICLQRTQDWITNNLTLKNKNLPNGLVKLPTRNVIINVE